MNDKTNNLPMIDLYDAWLLILLTRTTEERNKAIERTIMDGYFS